MASKENEPYGACHAYYCVGLITPTILAAPAVGIRSAPGGRGRWRHQIPDQREGRRRPAPTQSRQGLTLPCAAPVRSTYKGCPGASNRVSTQVTACTIIV